MLAAAGILCGHPATTHWVAQGMLSQFCAVAQREFRIVRSGKIVAAAGVSAGIDPGLFVRGEICGRERVKIVQLALEYDPQPPYDSGHPTKASAAIYEEAKKEMLERAKNQGNALSVLYLLWRKALAKARARGKGGNRRGE